MLIDNKNLKDFKYYKECGLYLFDERVFVIPYQKTEYTQSLVRYMGIKNINPLVKYVVIEQVGHYTFHINKYCSMKELMYFQCMEDEHKKKIKKFELDYGVTSV